METTKGTKRIAALLLSLLIAVTMSFSFTGEKAQAKGRTYWLKVNKRTCVVTVYKHVGRKWKAVRAMRCSVGKSSTPTPSGTYRVKSKWRWLNMKGCWGQYVSQFNGDYLFHSCWYYARNKAKQNITEYNKLGRPASHGCVRLAVIDAKWVYKHCKAGTKVTIFSGSSRKDKLGKPAKITSHSGWDPTDPTKGNPNFKLRRARIRAASKKVEYGSKYKLYSGVKAVNPNANENISSSLKVLWIKRSGRKTSMNTKRLGTYTIKYQAGTAYCRKGYKTIKVQIIDSSAADISGTTAVQTTQEQNASVDLLRGVTAKLVKSGKKIAVTAAVTAPNKETTTLTADRTFSFTDEGTYTITYKAKNPYSGRIYTKVVKITVSAPAAADDGEAAGQGAGGSTSQNTDAPASGM